MSESSSASLRSSKTTSSRSQHHARGSSRGGDESVTATATTDEYESAQSATLAGSERLKQQQQQQSREDTSDRSDDGLGDEALERGPGGASDSEPQSLPQVVLGWMRRNRCYLITVVCIFVIAIAIGAAPGALDLNNVEQYSVKPLIANRMRVKFLLDATPKVINTTHVFIAPLTTGTAVASAILLNYTRANTTAFDAQVEISSDVVNITAEEVYTAYVTAFANETFAAMYGHPANLSVVLNRSRETRAGQHYTPFAAWVTLLLVCLILALLMQEDAVPPDVVLMLALVVMTAVQIINVKEALAGFANEGIATIGALYIIALAVGNSGALDLLSRYILGAPTGATLAVARLMTPLTVLSAFINNTPIVAMMAPVVVSWAQRVNLPASKLLIPLSYAAILGGTITVIGTSTNLIVKALVQARDPTIDLPLFGVAPVGLPTAVLGVLYMVFIGHRILPARESPGQQYRQDPRAYSAHVVVKSDAKQIDRQDARRRRPAPPDGPVRLLGRAAVDARALRRAVEPVRAAGAAT
jgi:Na+/H+ antiporter NhaD/arsenite permease-like protein